MYLVGDRCCFGVRRHCAAVVANSKLQNNIPKMSVFLKDEIGMVASCGRYFGRGDMPCQCPIPRSFAAWLIMRNVTDLYQFWLCLFA